MENTSRGQAGLCPIEVMMPGQLRKWFHQVFFFLLFSFAGTVTQYLILSFLPYLLGYGLASAEFMWPQKEMSLFGIDYTWSLLGYNVLRDAAGNVQIGGGLGYFISFEAASFIAQCLNFPLQRNITFRSHGNVLYQAMWYFIAWILISLVSNGFNNLWMPIAAAYVSPFIYNILVISLAGNFAMVIYFFIYRIIFPEGKAGT